MEWYYEDSGKQEGPVSPETFEELVRDGDIGPRTLVWREGMEEWASYEKVFPPASPPDAPVAAPSTATNACSLCHQPKSLEEMVQIEKTWVCADCKPLFLQKLREGTAQTEEMQYAGFWIRFSAAFIDGLLLGMVIIGFLIPFVVLFGWSGVLQRLGEPQINGQGGTQHDPLITIVFYIGYYMISVGLPLFYETFMVGKYGATLGKMACKLRVVTGQGEKVSYARSLGRYFAKYLSYMTLYIGFIMIGLNEEKKGLHDYICNTRVIKK